MLACRHTDQWLQHTIRAWLRPTVRYASTTSAIKRGLRATREDSGRRATKKFNPGFEVRREGRRKRLEEADGFRVSKEPESLKREERRVQRESRSAQRDSQRDSRPAQPESRSAQQEPGSRLERRRQGLAGRRLRSAQSESQPAQRRSGAQRTNRPYELRPGKDSSERSVHDDKPDILSADKPLPRRHNAKAPRSYLHVAGAPSSRSPSPESQLEVVLPKSSAEEEPATEMSHKHTRPTRPTRRTTDLLAVWIRLRVSLERLQGHDETRSNDPASKLEAEEARALVDEINLAIQSESMNSEGIARLLDRWMGKEGTLWSRSEPKGKLTYLYVGEGDVFQLALRKQPGAPKRSEAYKTPGAAVEASKKVQSQRRSSKVEDEDFEDDIPLSIPYTTAASSFIYGSNTVLAALRAQRRKFYRLYLHPRLSAREGNATDIRALAKQLHVRTTDTANSRLLDKLSDGRPHNGVVLEASRLPAPPVLSLGRLGRDSLRNAIFPLTLDRQTAEDIAVNGAPTAIPTLTSTWRHPFVIMLDGITDEGNVGNILRTAHFYGVDAVAIATNTCAPLNSAILAKASSGACEALRILALPKPGNFIFHSRQEGWKIYGAVAPSSDRPAELRTPKEHERDVTTAAVAQASPLAKHPVILMLGAEGEGLRVSLRKKADHFVTIEQNKRAFEGGQKVDVGVDSLNVGVATGVLVEAFMRKPKGTERLDGTGELGF